jgi:hypothetical protein
MRCEHVFHIYLFLQSLEGEGATVPRIARPSKISIPLIPIMDENDEDVMKS